jgi:glycosyltransferase involved in cell wall biosynthesis
MEHIAKEISESLAKRGHQVKVFTSDWEFAHTPIIPSLFFKLLKILKDSIMHIHIAQAFIPEVVYLISKIKKIPYIAHIHGDTKPSGKFGFLLSLYKREMDKFNEWGKLENVLSYVSKRKNLKYLANSEPITNI